MVFLWSGYDNIVSILRVYSCLISYMVFIKYSVFSLEFCDFLNSASSGAALVFYLPGMCTHTDTEGKQRKVRVWNILKSLEKTQYLINTPYYNWTKWTRHLSNTGHFVKGDLQGAQQK